MQWQTNMYSSPTQHVQLPHTTHTPSAGPGAVADQHLLLSGPCRCPGTHGYICMPGEDGQGGETVRGVVKVGEFQCEHKPPATYALAFHTHSPCIPSSLSMHALHPALSACMLRPSTYSPPPCLHACAVPPLSACMRRPSTYSPPPCLHANMHAQAFHKRRLLGDFMTELCGDDGRAGGSALRQLPVPPSLYGRSYRQLFEHMVTCHNVSPSQSQYGQCWQV